MEKIIIGSDHGGWSLKETIKNELNDLGFEVLDVSAPTKESVDYPDIGHKVAKAVSEGTVNRGVLICGTGIGMSMVANRYVGVRAALCHNIFTARMSKEHNNANVLVMGERVLGEGLALEILKCWLETPFGEGRHCRRIDKINPNC